MRLCPKCFASNTDVSKSCWECKTALGPAADRARKLRALLLISAGLIVFVLLILYTLGLDYRPANETTLPVSADTPFTNPG